MPEDGSRRRHLDVRRPVVLLVGLALLGCSAAEETRGGGVERRELLELEMPPLAEVAPEVRERIEARRRDLEAVAARPEATDEELAEAYGALGIVFQAHELFGAARDCYRNARSLAPNEFAWAYYLGRTQRSLGEAEESAETLGEAIELRPEEVPALVARARALRDLGRLDEAVRLAGRARTLEPEAAGALLVAAQLAMDRGEHAAAVELYESLLRMQPEATRLHRPLAIAYRSLGETGRAEEHLALAGDRSVRVRDPWMQALDELRGGAHVHRAAGIEAFERGDFRGAAESFRLLVEAVPDDPEARLNLGSALYRLGDTASAAAAYREVLELEPAHAMAHFNLGVALAAGGDERGAIEHYRAALETDPDYRDPRFNLANALRRLGSWEEAVGHFRRLTEDDPRLAGAWLGEAGCLIELGRFVEVRRRLDDALRVHPGERTLTLVAARVLAASPDAPARDGEQALRLARELVEDGRTHASLETLAMALAETGRFDEAVDAQSEAIALAEAAGGPAAVERMRDDLERYRRGEPCRDPAVG